MRYANPKPIEFLYSCTNGAKSISVISNKIGFRYPNKQIYANDYTVKFRERTKISYVLPS